MLTFPSLVGRRNCCTHFEPRDSALIQASIAQIGLERQHLGPTSHNLDKRLPISETQPNPDRQEAHENPFSFARRSFLHRKRHMSYNASREEFGKNAVRLHPKSITRLWNVRERRPRTTDAFNYRKILINSIFRLAMR